jgi:hypothetical protein
MTDFFRLASLNSFARLTTVMVRLTLYRIEMNEFVWELAL